MTARGSSPTHEAPTCGKCGAPVTVLERKHGWPCDMDGDIVGTESGNERCTCKPYATKVAVDLPALRREAAAQALTEARLTIAAQSMTYGETVKWLQARAQALREGKD